MAASWGLAFQYGKKAYEDMWREQEENERLAATRKLYEMQVAEQEKAQEMQTLINDEVRSGQRVITKYKKQMAKGGEDGVKAYAAAMTEAGIPTMYLGDGKVGTVRADGQVDPASVRKMTGKDWNGTAIVSEFQKIVPSAEGMSTEYRQAVDRNIEREWEKDKLNAQLRSQMGIASMYANAKLKSAGLQAGAIREAAYADQFTKNWKELQTLAVDGASRSAMGNNVRGMIGEDGTPSFMKYSDKTGWQPYNPTDSELQSFTNDLGRIQTEGFNMMVNAGVPGQVGYYNVANMLGDARQYGMGLRADAVALATTAAQNQRQAARLASRQAGAQEAQNNMAVSGNWWSPLMYRGLLQ